AAGRRGGADGEVAGDAGADIGRAFERHPAAVEFHEGADQREAEAGAPVPVGAAMGLETVEDVRLEFRLDTYPRVLDIELDRIVVPRGADDDGVARAREGER